MPSPISVILSRTLSLSTHSRYSTQHQFHQPNSPNISDFGYTSYLGLRCPDPTTYPTNRLLICDAASIFYKKTILTASTNYFEQIINQRISTAFFLRDICQCHLLPFFKEYIPVHHSLSGFPEQQLRTTKKGNPFGLPFSRSARCVTECRTP